MEQALFIHGVLVPACCALALTLALRRRTMRWRGVALFVALLLGARANDSFGGFPPTNGWMWLVIAVGASVTVGATAGERGVSRVGRGIICLVAALMASLLLPLPMWRSADARLLLAAGLGATSMLMLPVGMHRGGFSVWCACSVAVAGTSAVALQTGFAKLAVSLGAVACACGWIGVASSVVRPRHRMPLGIAGTLAVVSVTTLGSATAYAYETASTPWWIFAASATAPLGCWLGEAPPFRASRMASAIARIAGVATLSGAAVIGTLRHAGVGASAASDAYACIGDDRLPAIQPFLARAD